MKFSEAWLREWVNPDISTSKLCEQLTMAGLEVGSLTPAAPDFVSVVIAEVNAVQAHPDADKLRVCKVSNGTEELQIVCGAINVKSGQKVALINVGGYLTNPEGKQFKIKKSKLRGVESHGMLCSAVELGLAENSDGILEFPEDAPLGQDVRDYLQLNDNVIEVELTPNRGDCLSLRGIAREVAAINCLPYEDKIFADVMAVPIEHETIMPISIHAPDNCRAFAGRVIKNIDPSQTTPVWMQERLRRSGLRPIHPVVDVSNFVMLESGQPTHTFDLRVLDEQINVRFANEDEELTLLDGKQVKLDNDILVIADQSKVLAMAGIMGGEHSGIASDTKDVFIECAHFTPETIAGKARRYGLHTDASHRYERGVDPSLLIPVVERITQLLTQIAGGEAGPINYVGEEILAKNTIQLQHSKIESLLGESVKPEFVLDSLNRLQIQSTLNNEQYTSVVPTHRFDLDIPEDLIEEVGRLRGLSKISSKPLYAGARLKLITEKKLSTKSVKQLLVQRGYSEIISYSFISEEQHRQFYGSSQPLKLQNPISSEMSVMRESLLPSLVDTMLFNQKRQQERMLIFEVGSRYRLQDNEIKEEKTISILRSGSRFTEQWGEKTCNSDFYDFKADIEALLGLCGSAELFNFSTESNNLLHPGQSMCIQRLYSTESKSSEISQNSGIMGRLHPAMQQSLGLDRAVYIAEIPYELVAGRQLPAYEAVSAFPASRRDLSLLMPESISGQELTKECKTAGPEYLHKVIIFDVYQGQGIESGQKSVGLGLIFQEKSRTLTDIEIDSATQHIVENLSQKLNTVLREG
jgi:phenylalanyl-tRNA synthetase beta chain